MDKLSNQILDQIKAKDIKPIPKSIFLLRNIGLGVISVLSTILGGISVSLLTYNAANQDWDIYRHLNESFFGFVVSSLPYLWIILVIISLVITVFNIEHSKNGYKYSPLKITIISMLLALILGFGGYALGLGKKIDNYLGSKFTSYQSVDAEKKVVWSQSEKGLFSGVIKTVDQNKKTFILDDFQGKQWIVDYKNANIRGRIQIESGSEVKIVGKQSGDLIEASEIRPWGNAGAGQGFGNKNGKGRNIKTSN